MSQMVSTIASLSGSLVQPADQLCCVHSVLLTVPLSTRKCKQVLAMCQGNLKKL